MIQGYLDGIIHGDLYGWALDQDDRERPVLLTICLDGVPVAETIALYHRPDVANLLGTSGYHGFYVDVQRYCSFDRPIAVDVRAHDGTRLPNSPLSLNLAKPENVDSHPALLYMHIPKTGGTSMRQALEGHYRLSQLAYLYPDAVLYPPDLQLWGLPIAQREQLRLIAGHFPYGLHEALASDYEYFAIVRNPVDRAVSQYNHFRRWIPELLQDGDQVLSFAGAYERRLDPSFDNLMVRYFSGVSPLSHPPGTVDKEVFEQAVENARKFIHIGVQAEIDRSYAFLSNRYSWNDSAPLERLNTSEIALDSETLENVTPVVEHFDHWDLLLYQDILSAYSG